MTTRISQRSIRFAHPFRLNGMDTVGPAGDYIVETEEESLEELSFPVFRRIATRLLLPGAPGSSILGEVIETDPAAIEAAQNADSTRNPGKASPLPLG